MRRRSPEPVRTATQRRGYPSPFNRLNVHPERTEALHAQISETLRGILSDDEFAAEAPE